jgi:hypothetical protein
MIRLLTGDGDPEAFFGSMTWSLLSPRSGLTQLMAHRSGEFVTADLHLSACAPVQIHDGRPARQGLILAG